MKTIHQIIGMTCMACMVSGLPVLSQATIITLGEGSKYDIFLESHVGNTWTYSVSEVSGKSLSHWNLGIPSCIEHITGYTPTQGYATSDGSTGFEGIKWDIEESFTSGTFSITLDADYPETTVLVQAKAGETGNEGTGDVIGPDCTTPPECSFVYGVHDDGLNDSYLFKVNPTTMVFEALGSPCIDCDIESLDISPEPNVLYGAAGDDTPNPGQLYKIDMVTGARELIGPPSGLEIDGISFNPVTGELVGWAQDVGLINIDPNTGTNTTILSVPGEFEDLTWDNAGTTLYAVYNDKNPADSGGDANAPHVLLAYNVIGNSVVEVEVCEQKLEGKEIEALETLPNGDLLLGYHESDNQPKVAVVNPASCDLFVDVNITDYQTSYKDIEGLAVCPPPAP